MNLHQQIAILSQSSLDDRMKQRIQDLLPSYPGEKRDYDFYVCDMAALYVMGISNIRSVNPIVPRTPFRRRIMEENGFRQTTLQDGAFIVFNTLSGHFLHAAVALDKGYAFHKMGVSVPEITTIEHIRSTYGTKPPHLEEYWIR
ncbi:hypothetical protein CL620_05530 [archaeon]|nr:hypothetical protein [archaeon]|tara:strand:- start:165 stop:596 length:432 start_codon:yes stop_codon:yes gene_type:complete